MPPFLILNSEYNNQISHNWKSSFSYISQQEQSHLTPIFGLSFIFYFSKQQAFRRLHKPDLTLTWKHTVYTIINQSAIVSSAIYTVYTGIITNAGNLLSLQTFGSVQNKQFTEDVQNKDQDQGRCRKYPQIRIQTVLFRHK